MCMCSGVQFWLMARAKVSKVWFSYSHNCTLWPVEQFSVLPIVAHKLTEDNALIDHCLLHFCSVTALLKKLKQQTRDIMEQRQPQLTSALQEVYVHSKQQQQHSSTMQQQQHHHQNMTMWTCMYTWVSQILLKLEHMLANITQHWSYSTTARSLKELAAHRIIIIIIVIIKYYYYYP